MMTHRPLQRGFTLIEMMIVLVIIGIIAAFVYPSYTAYMVKTRRAEAAGVMQEAAMYIERMYGQTRSYSSVGSANIKDALPAELRTSPKSSASPYYTLEITARTSNTYTLVATPTTRHNDPDCSSLVLDQDGSKTVSADATRAASECWGR